MAVSATLYNAYAQRKLDESLVIALAADNIKAMLCTSGYVPDPTHVYKNQVTNEVANGLGYATGGILLGGKVVGWDATGLFAYFDANDVVWAAPCTFTARRAVLYKDTGVASTSPLIGWIDFGVDKIGTGGVFALRWAAPTSGAIVRIRRG